MKLGGILILGFVILSSCKKPRDSDALITQSFVDSLTERQIGEMKYFISIPKNFKITENEGPDFSVFYFLNSDTTVTSNIYGGIYFGNFPSKFSPPNDSCRVEAVNSEIFGNLETWTVYNCGNNFSVQTIANTKDGEEWNSLTHAFGWVNNKNDLYKILKIYSTLHKRE